jgi:hypothetical protein
MFVIEVRQLPKLPETSNRFAESQLGVTVKTRVIIVYEEYWGGMWYARSPLLFYVLHGQSRWLAAFMNSA